MESKEWANSLKSASNKLKSGAKQLLKILMGVTQGKN